jgi:hypothetical protein
MKGGHFAIPPRIGFADVAQMPADHWSGRYHRSAINVPGPHERCGAAPCSRCAVRRAAIQPEDAASRRHDWPLSRRSHTTAVIPLATVRDHSISRGRRSAENQSDHSLTKSKRGPANILVSPAMVLSTGASRKEAGPNSFPGVGASVQVPIQCLPAHRSGQQPDPDVLAARQNPPLPTALRTFRPGPRPRRADTAEVAALATDAP